MGNMHIVTGYRGENHVTAADVGSFNAAIFGTGQYVLNRGNKFSTTTVSNNKIRIADGDLLIQGRHVRLNEGSYVDLTIENGAQGYLRNDLIVARYTKNSNTGIEDVNLIVIKGTPAASSPADPAYTSGDIINNHVYQADMPLYRVPLNGLNVQTLVPLFTEASISFPDGAVSSAKIADGAVTASKIASGAVTKNFTATIGTSWTGSSAPYTQSVTVSGLLASDKPIVDLVPSSTYATAEAQLEAWANIYRIVTAANKITVYATEKTTTSISIQMVVNRK